MNTEKKHTDATMRQNAVNSSLSFFEEYYKEQ
jgi:hypothetical protein